MISDLRSALALANEKVRNLENAKASASLDGKIPVLGSAPATADPDDPVGAAALNPDRFTVCPKCSKDPEEKENEKEAPPAVDASLHLTELKKMRDEWNALLHDRREIQHKLSSLDHLEKDFQHKIAMKNQKNDRVENASLSTLRYVSKFFLERFN